MNQNLLAACKVINQIYESSDYSIVKIKIGNREINSRHVKRLAVKISEDGLRIPIQINSKGEILDGQHRFFACKMLNIPFKFYIENEKTELEDIQKLNGINRSWSIEDVLKSKVVSGNPHYIEFDRIANNHNLRYTTLFHICEIRNTGFRDGKLKITDKNKIVQHIKDIETVTANWKDQVNERLEIAIYTFFKTYKTATVGDLVGKMIKYPAKTFHCNTTKEYIDCLFNLYNYNNRKPLKRDH